MARVATKLCGGFDDASNFTFKIEQETQWLTTTDRMDWVGFSQGSGSVRW
jgi:hypothetical protein